MRGIAEHELGDDEDGVEPDADRERRAEARRRMAVASMAVRVGMRVGAIMGMIMVVVVVMLV
ncbi:hypothetical protein S58_32970 [Bradyrhizobium oligotrophicum S58]|uniref:Uncharacterized protein n=1 Tax=Bradyrhizobium oligotrophicum S58 TaxID=1245469 RepID=M4Z750_9BRAD|nr:hypothetical protein S58_32970 [Bradyrhizobium oligotrophicum S58]